MHTAHQTKRKYKQIPRSIATDRNNQDGGSSSSQKVLHILRVEATYLLRLWQIMPCLKELTAEELTAEGLPRCHITTVLVTLDLAPTETRTSKSFGIITFWLQIVPEPRF